MAVWAELKVVLARLRDQQPGLLMGYPNPEGDEGRQPPFAIELAPWATTVAAQLHRQFGDNVDLTVGPFPTRPAARLNVRVPVTSPQPCWTRMR